MSERLVALVVSGESSLGPNEMQQPGQSHEGGAERKLTVTNTFVTFDRCFRQHG